VDPAVAKTQQVREPVAREPAGARRSILRQVPVRICGWGALRRLREWRESPSQPKLGRWLMGNAPMVAFLLIYTSTCLLGALLMLANYRPFVRLFEYFSGTHIPSLDATRSVVVLVLLCVAPLCLWLGYGVARRLPTQALPPAVSKVGTAAGTALRAASPEPPAWVPLAVFGVCGAVAFISVASAGALAAIPSWLNYGHFITAREEIFGHVGFLEFVNIYMFLPLSAAWVMLTQRSAGILFLIVRWLPLAFTEFIDLLLFQKKTAIISLLIVGFAWLFFHALGGIRTRRLVLGGWVTVSLGLIIYFAAVVVPVYSKASGAKVCLSDGGRCTGSGQVPALLAYSVLSPLTRTSAPALYYPIVFPSEHRFYGLDLFQDGIGLPSAFPDDNRVIWNAQYPHGPPGTSAAPFQFSLYSGTGLAGTLIECFVIGALMGVVWRLATSKLLSPTWSSLLASSVCVFAVYLAIDSWRDDTTVSYGALWAIFFLVTAGLAVHLLGDRARRLRSWRGALGFALLGVIVVGVVSHDYGGASRYVPAATRPASANTSPRSAAAPPSSAAGLPVGWSRALSGVGLVPGATAVSVTTTRAPYGYQVESPPLTLPRGSYVAVLHAKVSKGGIDLGVLDEGTQRWIRQHAFSMHNTRAMAVPFPLSRRTTVRVILSNDSVRATRSQWVIRDIKVTSTSNFRVAASWPAGLKNTSRGRGVAR
jgi:hypothetical protein